jgi:hypothetical protein
VGIAVPIRWRPETTVNETHMPERLAVLAELIAPGSGDGTAGPVKIYELDLARALRGDSMIAADALETPVGLSCQVHSQE